MLKEILWRKAGFGQGSAKPRITRQPRDITAQSGQSAVISLDATGATGYQWYSKGPEDADFSSVSGATAETYTHTAAYAEDGTSYKCVLTDGTTTATSDVVSMTVIPKALVITTQPEDTSGEEGDTVTFSVVADGETPSYQWQSKGDDWEDSTESGNQTDTLSLEASEEAAALEYRCVITDVDGNEVITDTVHLTVEEEPEDEGE